MICPKCNVNMPDDSKICKDCGHDFLEKSSSSAKKPENISVLIVDDTAFMRLVIRKLLVNHGFIVAGEASDAEDAVKYYKIYKPDLVMMDISMPGTKKYHQGGLDAIKEIVAFDPLAKIIVCSAMSDKSTVMEAIERGAKAYLVKPFDTKHLVHTINRLFEQP